MPIERDVCQTTSASISDHGFEHIILDAVIGRNSHHNISSSLTAGDEGLFRSWINAFEIGIRLNRSIILVESDTVAEHKYIDVNHQNADVVQVHSHMHGRRCSGMELSMDWIRHTHAAGANKWSVEGMKRALILIHNHHIRLPADHWLNFWCLKGRLTCFKQCNTYFRQRTDVASRREQVV